MSSNHGMQELIALINQLQDAASVAGLPLGELNLPQIAVIGGQSAGKSSVLENFVGRDFLPRGSGIVTRRPLVLQLVPCAEEYAEFLHIPNRRFEDFNQVREEIINETIRITGDGKSVSPVPINLHVYSPNVLELTLVDLPGMTRVAVLDQPPDIEEQIKQMVLQYVDNDNTLILAVTPANQDLANSDALQLAALVDPDGERTIGVITKLDLMDRGTDARDVLENKVYPLQRGYVGLVNRGQYDIENGKNIIEAQREEMEFFISHDAYRHMASRMGSKYLQKVLNKQLSEHIRKKLPQLASDIKQKHAAVRAELQKMNAFTELTTEWKHSQMTRLLQEFEERLTTSLEGNSVNVTGGILGAGAKINSCFYNEIERLLNQDHCPNEVQLATLVQNLSGYRTGLFPPGLAFDKTVGNLVKQYKGPLVRAVDLISTIISSTISECANELGEFPRLKDKVINLLIIRLQRQEAKTKKHLTLLVEAQSSYMNTKNPEFQRITSPMQISSQRLPLSPVEQRRKLKHQPSIAQSDIGTDTGIGTGALRRVPSIASQISKSSSEAAEDTVDNPQTPDEEGTVKKSQAIQKGWILHPGTVLRPPKDYWFVLSKENLEWYKNEDERELIGNTTTDGLTLYKNNKTKRFILGKGTKPLNSNFPKMQLIFKTEKDEEMWCNSCRRVGILMDEKNEPAPVVIPEEPSEIEAVKELTLSQPEGTNKSKAQQGVPRINASHEILQWKEMITKMVESYMVIIDKTIRDLVPKYIVLLLINAIIRYVKFSLVGEITKSPSCLDLMEESSEEAERKKKLMQVYEATQKALSILNNVSFSM